MAQRLRKIWTLLKNVSTDRYHLFDLTSQQPNLLNQTSIKIVSLDFHDSADRNQYFVLFLKFLKYMFSVRTNLF